MTRYIELLVSIFFCLIIAAMPLNAASLPLVVDFELSDGGFTTASSNSWKWGSPNTSQGPTSARSGTQVWGTNINGSYAADLNASLVSPAYDFSAATGKYIVLHWWQYLVTEEGFDAAEVQVSKNNGSTWETVFGPRHGIVNDQWTEHTVLLDPTYATDSFKVRFRLVTDASVAEGGFFIDDLRISAASFEPIVELQDFEADTGGYVAEGENVSWQYGAPISMPGSAYSGTSVWATNLNGFYQANEDSTLTSPVMDLTGATGKVIALSWRQFFDTEGGYDFLDVEVSNNEGQDWQTALVQSGEVSSKGWSRMQVFLPPEYATANFQLRFRLASDEAYQYDGVAIDDIVVLAAPDVFPIAASFSKAVAENFTITFRRENFTTDYMDPDGGELDVIRIEQLPSEGMLKLNGAEVTLGQLIDIEVLDSLTYEPPANTIGSWQFLYSTANYFALSPFAAVTLNVLGSTPQIVIVEHPQAATVNPGLQVILRVGAVSSLPLSYQWRFEGVDISGANAQTLTLNSITEDNEGDYEVVVFNSDDNQTSDSAFVSVDDPVVIESEPSESFVNEGGEINFVVSATGSGRLDYQWFRNGEALLNETFATLQIGNAAEQHTGNYHCVVSNMVGPKSTSVFPFKVRLAPRIISNPAPFGIRRFRPAIFEVVAAGEGPFTYQWYHNGVKLPGADKSVFIINRPSDANLGSYTVHVSNEWLTVQSDPVELQVLFWADIQGVYQDVLTRDITGLDQSKYSGIISLKIGKSRSVSGKLRYEGKAYSFRGKFNMSMVLERVYKGINKLPLNVRLEFNALQQTVAATVTQELIDGESVSRSVLPLHRYHISNPAPQQGRYTVLAEAADGQQGVPASPAFLSGTINKKGNARLVGRLPSGKAFLSSSMIHSTSRLPFYTSLGSRGQVCGRIVFSQQDGTMVLGGELVWRHLSRPNTTFMPNSFVAGLDVEGALYVKPAFEEPVLSLPVGTDLYVLKIDHPLHQNAVERWVRISLRSYFRISPVSDAKIKLNLSRRTGYINGSYIDIDTGKKHQLSGVVNQYRQSLGGFFKTAVESGKFSMVPLLK